MKEINYRLDDKTLSTEVFLGLAQKIWPGNFDSSKVDMALSKTLNITAWDEKQLVGCVRLLSDGYFFTTVPEILVDPVYQGQGIGRRLMEAAFEISPTSLFFGVQPGNELFFEKLGYQKGLQSYVKRKARQL